MFLLTLLYCLLNPIFHVVRHWLWWWSKFSSSYYIHISSSALEEIKLSLLLVFLSQLIIIKTLNFVFYLKKKGINHPIMLSYVRGISVCCSDGQHYQH